MERTQQPIRFAAAHTATALALVVGLALTPSILSAKEGDVRQERIDARITSMHAKLKIMPTQEADWTKVTDIMRENAKVMDGLTQSRSEGAKTMSAVDDLKSYSEIAEAHADGLKKFTPAFTALYETMSDAQKKEADMLFRHGDRKHADKLSKNK